VYEVRAFWEDGFVNRWRGGDQSIRYRISRSMETRLFRRANAVVSISRGMGDEIAGRGIPPGKLFTIPNGVDLRRFSVVAKDASVIRRLGLEGKPVAGFIGSFYQFEGLDCLVKAMVFVRRVLPQARLVLVGGGECEREVGQLVEELGLQGTVVLVGKVSHTEVISYYSAMDVLIYPRHRNRTTELVTPLKPLEAMAMAKPVIGSDVGGVRELLDAGRVGVEFEAGNSEQLADRIVTLLTDADLRARFGEAGRSYVVRERSWDQIVGRYQNLYQRLLSPTSVTAAS
jgi:glycosyltransferase involved in cell wall biosynthesis